MAGKPELGHAFATRADGAGGALLLERSKTNFRNGTHVLSGSG
jgi:hypothetical protein